ncbi:hypothetical protein LTR53_003092 [Teratosphaeriaceae sp. CCFEE 6253]|nr:hypothetical protein LTR53_003092 [Teratosphaeriaceae sp. CCFEE 6253]
MRSILSTAILLTCVLALQLPDTPLELQPFLAALSLANTSQTTPAPLHDALRRRQATLTVNSACPTSYNNCANLGAANLCCDANAVCSADYAGHVACCRSGAACSGVISSVITAGTVSNGVLVGAAGAAGATTTPGGLVTAGQTTTTDYGVPSTTAANSNGLVLASATTATTEAAQGSGFVLDGGSTVATPGLGLKNAEVPMIAKAILKALQYLPI